MADASLPELLGHAIGRHLPGARTAAGLALTIAALGTLGVSIWGALVPFHYDSTAPPLGEVCFTTGGCVKVDQDGLDQAFEDDINHSNRVIGTLGALTSTAALVVGWRLWRSPWKHRNPTVRRARTVIAAACLSPLAAAPIFALVVLLYWSYDSLFE